MNLTVRELTNAVKGQLVLGDPKTAVTNVSVDSRLIQPGTAFFAFKGEKVDGHDFAIAASRQGAACVVVTHLDWMKDGKSTTSAVIRVPDSYEAIQSLGHFMRNKFTGPVVGVTGSNGKTTTKQMVTSVLRTKEPGLSTKGNFNSQIGLPIVLSMLEPQHKWIVLEMGASAPGNITALADIARPSIGILTSIGPAHLATFGSLERVAESKWELMDSLPADGCAIVPWGEPLLEPHIRAYGKRIIFFGEDSACPVRATAIETTEQAKFRLQIGSSTKPVTLPVPGRYNISNALAAAAAGWALDLSIDQIVHGLENFEPPKMRSEVHHHSSGAIIINDAYNANPASMRHAARSIVESFPSARKIMVAGSMLELGPDSEKLHFHMGADLARFPFEKVFLVGKEMASALEGAKSHPGAAGKFSHYYFMEDLVREIAKELEPNTVILFKASRGVQLEKVIEPLLKLA